MFKMVKEGENGFAARLANVIGDKPVSKFAREAGLKYSTVRNLLKGTRPTIDVANKIASAGGVSLDWLVTGSNSRDQTTEELKGKTLPVKGWARCSLQGYLQDERPLAALPAPADIGEIDADAFYARACGQSMQPEGIHDGDYCLIMPNIDLLPGRRVWLQDRDGRATIKRLIHIDPENRLHLRGWLNAEDNDRQNPYNDRWLPSNIVKSGVVMAVYRGQPDLDFPPPKVPDPNFPDDPAWLPRDIAEALNLTRNATIADAVKAIETLQSMTANDSTKSAKSNVGDGQAGILERLTALEAEISRIKSHL